MNFSLYRRNPRVIVRNRSNTRRFNHLVSRLGFTREKSYENIGFDYFMLLFFFRNNFILLVFLFRHHTQFDFHKSLYCVLFVFEFLFTSSTFRDDKIFQISSTLSGVRCRQTQVYIIYIIENC